MQEIPKFVQLDRLSLEDFIVRINETAKIKTSKSGNVYKYISTRKKHWIYLIENDILICPVTGKKVSYCSYDRMDYQNPKIKPTFHYNFYSDNDELFSIDHKIPISKGGSKMSVNNIQPMIIYENFNKKDKLIYI